MSLLMNCRSPAKMWVGTDNPWQTEKGWMEVPCRKCLGCRSQRAMQWGARIKSELRHNEGVFITLTYTEEKLPCTQSGRATLVKKDLQKFIKRLRWHYRNAKLKYYCCGEYGGETNRPHYHIAVLGLEWEWLKPIPLTSPGHFSSQVLSELWNLNGFVEIGILNDRRINYIVNYMTKVLSEDYQKTKYFDCVRPFSTMSKGLGKDYINEIIKSAYAGKFTGYINTLQGKAIIPTYYLRKIKDENPELYEKVIYPVIIKRVKKNRRLQLKKYEIDGEIIDVKVPYRGNEECHMHVELKTNEKIVSIRKAKEADRDFRRLANR